MKKTWMRWVPMLAGAFLLLAAGCSGNGQEKAAAPGADGKGAPEADSGPPPKLTAAELEHNSGDVNRGDKIAYTFILKNEGRGTLKIKGAHGS